MKPHHVGPLTLPLARRDGKLSTAKVTLRQDRLFLVGEESAILGITCDDGDGPATCAIASATAIVPPDVKDAGSHPTVPITFSEGEGGGMTTVFQPSSQGFGGYRGPIRVELNVGVSGETGGASFDLVYTPAAPAVFTGRIHEVLREGSLDLEVEVDVTAPGRYVFAARADDAEGRSFAYLGENEELPAGKQDVRLRVFGKLIRDESARSPFKLRDLEGFRLLEDAYPDRDLMSAREGVIYTTKTYVLKDFSDAEWESEEKTRHVTELTKDVNEAKGHVQGP